MGKLAQLKADLKAVKRDISLHTNGGHYCKRCYTKSVHWVTLDRPYLMNNNGTGQHVCSGPQIAPKVDTAALLEEGFTNEEAK